MRNLVDKDIPASTRKLFGTRAGKRPQPPVLVKNLPLGSSLPSPSRTKLLNSHQGHGSSTRGGRHRRGGYGSGAGGAGHRCGGYRREEGWIAEGKEVLLAVLEMEDRSTGRKILV